MAKRRGKCAKKDSDGDCFIFFDDQAPEALDSSRRKARVGTTVLESAVAGSIGMTDRGYGIDLYSNDDSEHGWRGDDSQLRFLQFAFERKSFFIDIPKSTLFPAEAQKILRDRNGFFFLADRPQQLKGGTRFNPLCKVYINGDEQCAAEDAAFILFDVWNFPIDSRFHVSGFSNAGWKLKAVPIE